MPVEQKGEPKIESHDYLSESVILRSLLSKERDLLSN